ncbi:636_t:CDS:2 [Acaulospora morrowiae]|uniref:636_t:CDS:1 n=1 Tax=Acaulospora morrowiae TaxID=94023 RepID=A0A9N9DB65_9GLOM|nr:636_t:CDS:2 [Acaulospora morrowiae]
MDNHLSETMEKGIDNEALATKNDVRVKTGLSNEKSEVMKKMMSVSEEDDKSATQSLEYHLEKEK